MVNLQVTMERWMNQEMVVMLLTDLVHMMPVACCLTCQHSIGVYEFNPKRLSDAVFYVCRMKGPYQHMRGRDFCDEFVGKLDDKVFVH